MVNRIVTEQRVDLDSCHRCGGRMVAEFVQETGDMGWRCVICGERVAPVILAHRRRAAARAEAEHLCSAASPN